MKKYLYLLLCLCLIISAFSACSKKGQGDSSNTSSTLDSEIISTIYGHYYNAKNTTLIEIAETTYEEKDVKTAEVKTTQNIQEITYDVVSETGVYSTSIDDYSVQYFIYTEKSSAPISFYMDTEKNVYQDDVDGEHVSLEVVTTDDYVNVAEFAVQRGVTLVKIEEGAEDEPPSTNTESVSSTTSKPKNNSSKTPTESSKPNTTTSKPSTTPKEEVKREGTPYVLDYGSDFTVDCYLLPNGILYQDSNYSNDKYKEAYQKLNQLRAGINNGIQIMGFIKVNGKLDKNLVIPSHIDGKPVEIIQGITISSMFDNESGYYTTLESITIPSTVKLIAFFSLRGHLSGDFDVNLERKIFPNLKGIYFEGDAPLYEDYGDDHYSREPLSKEHSVGSSNVIYWEDAVSKAGTIFYHPNAKGFDVPLMEKYGFTVKTW